MTLLLASLAWGQTGRLVLEPTEGATVRLFPQTDSSRLEWAVDGNVAPLHRQMGGRVEHVLETGAHGVGNGTWLVTVWAEPDTSVRGGYHWEGERLVLEIEPAAPDLVQIEQPPTVEELISDEHARWVVPSDAALHPLQGAASTLAADPTAWPIQRTGWTAPGAPIGVSDWDHVDTLRAVYINAEDPVARAAALYRLGEVHEDLGFFRESAYYFARARDLGAPVERVALDQAQSAFALGRFDDGRAFCVDAHTAGAPEAQVVECLAVASLGTATPAPAPTGRALARASGRPDSLLLAAQLLQMDGRHREALPLLQAIVESGDPEVADRANASLGEAHFYLGDYEAARVAWRSVTTGELGQLVWARQRLLLLITQGPASWPTEVPDLYLRSEDEGVVGAEALYLLGQINEGLGDSEGAATHYHDLMSRYPTRSARADVAARQWAVLRFRMDQLHRANRHLELVSLHRDRWNGLLEAQVDDPTPLTWVASAYDALGLPQQALDIQRDVFAVNTRLDRSDPAAVLQLARLYSRTEHHADALETIDWLRAAGIPRELRGPVHLLEGDAYAALKQEPQALRAWRTAALSEDTRREATARMALADAASERCDAAVPALKGLALDLEAPEVRDGRVHLALAMCLDAQGDDEGTAMAAKAAAGRLEDEVSRRYAMWLADKAARDAGQEDLVTEAVRSGDDLWAALGRENEAHEAFTALLDGERN